jgi:hypothetical protein
MGSGLGDLSWDVVSNPKELTEPIDIRRGGANPAEVAMHFLPVR